MADKAADLKHQDSSHRRGLVLGLTMAEIMVLILFILLLALADSINAKNERIADLRRQLAAIEAIIATSGPNVSVSDIIQRLERQQREIEQFRVAAAKVPELERKAATLDQLLKAIQGNGAGRTDRENVAEAIERGMAAARENENLRGQNVQLSEQIKRSGKGNEFPSCWATLDGKPESIFEVTLRPTGIVVHDRALSHRVEDQKQLPLKQVIFDAELSRDQFSDQLRPLYQWSVMQKCRFYIIRYTQDRSVDSDFVNVIDGFFYPDSTLQYRPANR